MSCLLIRDIKIGYCGAAYEDNYEEFELLGKPYLASPWAPICCRIPPSANNTQTVRNVCSWYPPREAWSTGPSCRRECRTERNCYPRDRIPRVGQTGPRITRPRDCRPAVGSDADQTNSTACTLRRSCGTSDKDPVERETEVPRERENDRAIYKYCRSNIYRTWNSKTRSERNEKSWRCVDYGIEAISEIVLFHSIFIHFN